jgi:hypothetical protein
MFWFIYFIFEFYLSIYDGPSLGEIIRFYNTSDVGTSLFNGMEGLGFFLLVN